MDEPVGNGPRTPQLQGNTHRDQAARKAASEQDKTETPRESLDKVVTGVVVTRKTPWWKRAAKSMVAEDAPSVGDHVLNNVVLPAIRVAIAESVMQATNHILFGGRMPRNTGFGLQQQARNPGYHTRFDRAQPQQQGVSFTQRQQSTMQFEDVVFPSRIEAISVVETMMQRVAEFGTVTVADFYDYCGTTGSYAARNWGWVDLSTADVKQTRGGWLLLLPDPIVLRG